MTTPTATIHFELKFSPRAQVVRFTPESRHSRAVSARPLCASAKLRHPQAASTEISTRQFELQE